MAHKYAHRPVWSRQFFNWGSFFPKDFSLCQIGETKQTKQKTKNKSLTKTVFNYQGTLQGRGPARLSDFHRDIWVCSTVVQHTYTVHKSLGLILRIKKQSFEGNVFKTTHDLQIKLSAIFSPSEKWAQPSVGRKLINTDFEKTHK